MIGLPEILILVAVTSLVVFAYLRYRRFWVGFAQSLSAFKEDAERIRNSGLGVESHGAQAPSQPVQASAATGHVFLSYASSDRSTAQALADALTIRSEASPCSCRPVDGSLQKSTRGHRAGKELGPDPLCSR